MEGKSEQIYRRIKRWKTRWGVLSLRILLSLFDMAAYLHGKLDRSRKELVTINWLEHTYVTYILFFFFASGKVMAGFWVLWVENKAIFNRRFANHHTVSFCLKDIRLMFSFQKIHKAILLRWKPCLFTLFYRQPWTFSSWIFPPWIYSPWTFRPWTSWPWIY